jgi:signal transduction histidine kinase
MKIDTPTVIILTIINVLIMLMILIHTRLTRKTYSGFDVWITGSALWFIGSVLSYILRGFISPFWVVVIGNGLMQALPICFLDGVNRFYAIPGRWWRTPLNLAVLAVSVVLLYYFTLVADNISARGVIISFCYALFFSRAAIEPLMVPHARRHSMQWLLFACFIPMVIVHILRVSYFLAHPELHTFAELVVKDKLLIVVMMMSSFSAILISYSYLSLTSARVEEELTASENLMTAAYDAERESREMQDRFLEMISHEYRTPVAIIQANLDILGLKSEKLDCVLSPELTKMHRAVVRLVEIFEAAKRRDGFDKRSLVPEFETTAVEPYLREVLDGAVEFWGDRFVLRTQKEETCCNQIDRQLFRTALLNLLDNAVKYSRPDSVITLNVESGDHTLAIFFANSTCADIPTDLKTLLDKYQRGGNSTGTSGTGVGLYLVRWIIEQHGGSITLEAAGKNDMLVTVKVPCE